MPQATCMLAKKQWMNAKQDFLLFIFFIVLTLVLLISIPLGHSEPQDALLALRALSSSLLANWDNQVRLIVFFMIFPGFFAFGLRANKLERLILSPEGIRYVSSLPSFLKRFMPDWSLQWSKVTSFELKPLKLGGSSPNLAVLHIKHGGGEQKIHPFHWADPITFTPRRTGPLFSLNPFVRNEKPSQEHVMESDVVRYIRRQVPETPLQSSLGDPALTPTDLEKDFHGKVSVVLIFLMMGYTGADILMGPQAYIELPPFVFYLAAEIAGAALAGVGLAHSKLALSEKYGLALLMGVVVSVAMLPGALRINALFNDAETQPYQVVKNGNGIVLRPLTKGWPSIDYFADDSYWNQFDKDEIYPVKVRKGILGFYQFDAASITEDMDRFHADPRPTIKE